MALVLLLITRLKKIKNCQCPDLTYKKIKPQKKCSQLNVSYTSLLVPSENVQVGSDRCKRNTLKLLIESKKSQIYKTTHQNSTQHLWAKNFHYHETKACSLQANFWTHGQAKTG